MTKISSILSLILLLFNSAIFAGGTNSSVSNNLDLFDTELLVPPAKIAELYYCYLTLQFLRVVPIALYQINPNYFLASVQARAVVHMVEVSSHTDFHIKKNFLTTINITLIMFQISDSIFGKMTLV